MAGKIHTELTDFNHCLLTQNEYIAGPVPEFYVSGGGDFEKEVEIVVPHCVGRRHRDMRVLYGPKDNLKVTATQLVKENKFTR